MDLLTDACGGPTVLPLEGQSVFDFGGGSAVVAGEWSKDVGFLAVGVRDDTSTVHLLFAFVRASDNWCRLEFLKNKISYILAHYINIFFV